MNERHQDRLAEALGVIGDDYIVEATADMKWYRKTWIRWTTVMAACICFVLGGMLVRQNAISDKGVSDKPAKNVAVQDGITIPAAEVDRSPGGWLTDFVIYRGNIYRGSYVIPVTMTSEIPFGEYIGEATDLPNGWSASDGLVELAGNVSGDLYTVEGYDSTFMIAVKGKTADERNLVLVRDNNITISSGADLYQERLQLVEGIDKVEAFSGMDMADIRVTWDGNESVVAEFVETLNAGEVMKASEMPKEQQEMSAEECYYIIIKKVDGMSFCLVCLPGGYVIYDGMQEVCVKVPERIMNAVLDMDEEIVCRKNKKNEKETPISKETAKPTATKLPANANIVSPNVVENTEARMILEPPQELYQDNVVAKYYIANEGNPYVIYGVLEKGKCEFKKCSLSQNYEWVLEPLPGSEALANIWVQYTSRQTDPEESNDMFLEADSKGNLYVVTFEEPMNGKPVLNRISNKGKRKTMKMDAVLDELADGEKSVIGLTMAGDDTLIFFYPSEVSPIAYHQYDIGIRYRISDQSVPTEPESMHWEEHVAFDPYDSEYYYLMDLESQTMLKRAYGETIPEKVIQCKGIRGEMQRRMRLTYTPTVLAGMGYLATKQGIYRGSIEDEEWKLWVPQKDMYGVPKSDVTFSLMFDFAAALQGRDREYMMVTTPEELISWTENGFSVNTKGKEAEVMEYWVLY